MPYAKGIVRAFRQLREPAQALIRADGVEPVLPPCQDLVDIGLVAHIEDDLVGRAVIHPVQRQRQLHHTQVRRQMAAVLGHDPDDELPDFLRQLLQFRQRKAPQVLRAVHPVQNPVITH